YLLAVQAVVRGATQPPAGLAAEQRRAVEGWIAELRDRTGELRARLGIGAEAEEARERPAVVRFDDEAVADETPRKTAFRWRTHRAGVGALAGGALGFGIALALASTGGFAAIIIGGALGGHLIGRRVQVPRCSACATVLSKDAATCPRCG